MNESSLSLSDSIFLQTSEFANGKELAKLIKKLSEKPDLINTENVTQIHYLLVYLEEDLKQVQIFDQSNSEPLAKLLHALSHKVATLHFVHKGKFEDAVNAIDVVPTRETMKQHFRKIGINIL